MDEFKNILNTWQEFKPLLPKDKLNTQQNSSALEKILEFEQELKSIKNKDILSLIISCIVYSFFLTVLSFGGKIHLSSFHCLGFFLIFLSVTLSIIFNKTDDFPDMRLHSPLNYLKSFALHFENRKKRNFNLIILSMLLFSVGCFIAFDDLFIGERDDTNFLIFFLLPLTIVAVGIKLYQGLQKKKRKMNDLQNEIDRLIIELGDDI